MEAQREEMERQRNPSLFEIEMLGERIPELEEKRGGSTEGHHGKRKKSYARPEYTCDGERSYPASKRHANPTGSRRKISNEPQSYASVAAPKPIRNSEQPWTKVSYGNQKTGTFQHLQCITSFRV